MLEKSIIFIGNCKISLIVFQMAKLISGKEISLSVRQKLREEVSRINSEQGVKFCPGLVIVQVGDRSDSNVYIRQKLKAAEEIGIAASHLKLPR